MLVVGAGQNQYNLYNSLRFRASASAYLSRTPGSASNRQIWTWSGWVKRGRLGVENHTLFAGRTSASATYTLFYFSNTDTLNFLDNGGAALTTTQLFRDPSAWYHLVLSVDTTQATAANRVKMYVNGNQITAFSTATYPTQNANLNVNTTATQVIGDNTGAAQYFDGYLAEINFIDGQALPPTAFAAINPATGVGAPIKYTGTYGTNGFYLPFSDTSALTTSSNVGLGKDFSGNSNYWTTNNISVTSGTTYDAMKDSPTNTSATVANYCTLNPLDSGASFTPSDGNMRIVLGSSLARTTRATIGVSTGKWYFETVVGGSGAMVGVATASAALSNYTGSDASGWSYYGTDGNKYTGGVNTAYGSTYTANDVIGVALDMDSGKVWFSKNGTWQASGDPAAGTNAAYSTLSGVVFPVLSYANTGGTSHFNAGQRPFSYTPPTGYVALNTYNLPTPTILQGNKYMDATLYTGTGSALSVTNAGSFKPDFVWIKDRTALKSNTLYNSSSGIEKVLFSNTTDAEVSVTGSLTAFNSNGFSVGSSVYSNVNNDNFVAWQWQAGQGTTSSNASGTITSTTSVNATAGFSIVTYTGNGTNGATVGHGLGVKPAMVIIKARGAADNWPVWQKSLASESSFLRLNATDAVNTSTGGRFTAFSSTTITLGTNSETNTNTGTYVAYCWAEISGFSKFGSYTGNGSTDGPFVFTNFRPKFIMWKRTDTTGTWYIYDTSRSSYNASLAELYPNLSNAEANSATGIDILSNGWKIRTSGASDPNVNASGGTYIYAAFAENPFKNALAR